MSKTNPIFFFLILLIATAFTFNSSVPSSDGFNYIEEYKELAIAEMHRTGIPASITLAQGMHESNLGKSDLATKAYNHFGIKCKTYWKGQTYYHKDDDFDKKGKLINSCFRAYNDAVESYIDHSNFLKFTENYMWLFTIKNADYKSWAYGLKNSGYATDKNYANKLIKLVETYNLNAFDSVEYQLLKNK